MILDPFKTTITKAYKSEFMRGQVIRAAIAAGNVDPIFEVKEGDTDTPLFSQPLIFNMPGRDKSMVAIDTRQYKGSNGFVMEQVALLRMRAALTLYGAREENLSAFYHPVAQIAYANIVAGIISQRFGVDPKLKLQITAAAAAHYYNITHSVENGYNDTELPMLMQSIIRNLHLPMDIVDVTLDKMEYSDTLEGFCKNIQRVDGTDRTADFSPGLMINGCSGLWFGINANETTAVALEHAPTFCAMLYQALGDGSYSRGEMAKRLKYVSAVRQKAETFRKTIRTIESEVGYA